MSLLQVRDLALRIGERPILHDLSFDMAPGEIVAITGESGSGKSMTALSIMGLVPGMAQIGGRIGFDGEDLLQMSEAALCKRRGNDIGMVFQEPMTALNPLQTIGAQVAEVVQIHTGAARTQAMTQARETLQRVGLDLPLTRYPHELSGGQRQRVVIAMAIVMRPRLLIADEPTTALDVTTQARILGLLRDLVRENDMALLLITHDLGVVADIAQRILVMQQGRIVEQGETRALLREMQHPYTRSLFAAATHQVNLPPAPAPTPMLKLSNINRDYPLPRRRLFGPRPHFRALQDISFDIGRGERLGLVGESGCGKSTLTRAILGLEDVQGGSITFDGAPGATDKKAVRRKMQVVFQDPYSSFNPRHRVGRLITEPFHLTGQPPPPGAVAQALTQVGLSPDDADKYIHAFSGGQRQRIAIARALITAPDLIIFDEAVSALDVSVRAQILDLIVGIAHDTGMAYLFISHDLSVVRNVTDRVMVMQQGRIVEQGPTAQVLATPQQNYTKSLIAAAPRFPNHGTEATA